MYAFYNFNEGDGTVVNDLTSNSFNGTLLNMDPATDWIAYDNCISIIALFPNPSSEFIQVSGLKKTESYKIYTILGEEISSGKIFNNKINIQSLASGIYFLKFKNNITYKFIKN